MSSTTVDRQQLARILTLAVGFKHLVNPLRRQRLLQRDPCHDARWRLTLKTLQYLLPHRLSAFVRFCNYKEYC